MKKKTTTLINSLVFKIHVAAFPQSVSNISASHSIWPIKNERFISVFNIKKRYYLGSTGLLIIVL